MAERLYQLPVDDETGKQKHRSNFGDRGHLVGALQAGLVQIKATSFVIDKTNNAQYKADAR